MNVEQCQVAAESLTESCQLSCESSCGLHTHRCHLLLLSLKADTDFTHFYFVYVCSMKAELCHMNFQHLDFGEIDALDKFHNADVAVVDMSIHVQQASLFYHIGMRENMGMPETIILLNDTDPDFTLSVKVF